MEGLSELSKLEQDEKKWHDNPVSMLQPENVYNILQVPQLR